MAKILPFKVKEKLAKQELYVSIQDKNLYTHLDDKYVQISDIIFLDTEKQRENLISPLSNKLYIVRESGTLWQFFEEWSKLSIPLNVAMSKTYTITPEMKSSELDKSKRHYIFRFPNDFNTTMLQVNFCGVLENSARCAVWGSYYEITEKEIVIHSPVNLSRIIEVKLTS